MKYKFGKIIKSTANITDTEKYTVDLVNFRDDISKGFYQIVCKIELLFERLIAVFVQISIEIFQHSKSPVIMADDKIRRIFGGFKWNWYGWRIEQIAQMKFSCQPKQLLIVPCNGNTNAMLV